MARVTKAGQRLRGARSAASPPPATASLASSGDARLAQVAELAQAVDLAWTGEHDRAIEVCTATLDASHPSSACLEALDLRAESHIALGQFDRAARDAAAMAAMAKRAGTAEAHAKACNRQALVAMRQGKLADALPTATRGLGYARQTHDERLIAGSVFRVGEAQMRLRQAKSSADCALDAAERYRRLSDASGEGRALWVAANAKFQQNRPKESRKFAQRALALCRKAGDWYGVGNALNAMGLYDLDIADNIRHLQQAAQAFEQAGYVDRVIVVRVRQVECA